MVDLTYYDVLGIERGADEQTVRRAVRAQQRATHPDTTGVNSHVQYDLVMRAGQTLTDPAKRAAYDASLDAPADPWATSAPAAPQPAAPAWGPGAYAAGPRPAAPAPEPEPEPQWTDPGGPNARRNTTIWLAAGGTLALAGVLVASILYPTMAPVTLLAALALSAVGAFTWRRGGWTLKPMLVTNAAIVALALMLAATDPTGGPPLEHMARLDAWDGSIGLLLVLIGIDAATVRLTVRRRALYEWTPVEQ
ncbi:J domain-containing protein [Cellulosimicrobium sp. Marseille-Q4280]|uniref:J domain-containing protein n=1 Tax=Cellulosimicrobium sp. Marseille-Q4280 TaxID=2937992 RepID=UPI00203C5969|nr:J domain-containing protein [Cellulosimicrobium sp. Marseille-Q4280]